MPYNCCVPKCYNNSSKNKGLHFYRLPKQKKLLRLFKARVRNNTLKVESQNTRICSVHFQGGRKYDDELPSIFPWTKIEPPRKPPKEREPLGVHQLQNQISSIDSNNIITDVSQAEPSAEVIELRKQLSNMTQLLRQRDDEIVQLRSENRQLKNAIGHSKEREEKHLREYMQLKEELAKSRENRLRLGLFEKDMAERFEISVSTVSRICSKWIDLMYYDLKEIDIWPSRELVDLMMPSCFKEKYPTTRVVIDATEIQMEKPSSPDLQSLTYSCYKSRNTVKGLVGITPSGAVSFVSDLHTGSVSDKELTIFSGLPDKLEKGDGVMADKGFNIQDELAAKGAVLNMPPFVTPGQQMSVEDVIETRSIAAVRIHVERCMERIKNYHIFDRPIPVSLCALANQMFYVCAVLTNFLPPLIPEVKNNKAIVFQ
ncbi:uncharacterized protein [Ptychodera flava]|uniref:uncharacterized protein isoform X2 n=1 Tax=Ptychodera flava TaxID=63121 RepID=UPI00396A7DDA